MRAKKRCHSSRAATGSLALSCSIQMVTECEEGCIGGEPGVGDGDVYRSEEDAGASALSSCHRWRRASCRFRPAVVNQGDTAQVPSVAYPSLTRTTRRLTVSAT